MHVSKRDEAITLILSPTAAWSNETFASELCDAMNTSVVTVVITPTTTALHWLLPDCLFGNLSLSAASFQGLTASQLILRAANSSFPNPFARLPSRMTSITLANALIQTYDAEPYFTPTSTADWTTLFDLFPVLNEFSLSGCGVYGTLPNTIPARLCFFFMSSNHLTGTIPATLYQDGSQNCLTLGFKVDRNSLSGTVPSEVFDPFLFPADDADAPSYSTVVLSNNNFTGSIPTSIICPAYSNRSLLSIVADVSSNNFTGTIPSAPFTTCNLTSTIVANWTFSNNQLTGDLPQALMMPSSTPVIAYWLFDASSNPLSGTIPDGFLNSLQVPSSPTPVASAATVSMAIRLINTSITGALTLPDLSSRLAVQPNFRLALSVDNSALTSVTFDSSAGNYLAQFLAPNSHQMTGTVPSTLFSSTGIIQAFDVSNSSMSGILPDIGSLTPPRLRRLLLENTIVDFCSGTRTVWTSSTLVSCDLLLTNASYCPELYPSICTVTPLPPTTPQLVIPQEAPQLVPQAVPQSHPTASSASPSSCQEFTRPSSEFICIDGIWTSTGSVNTTVLTIPSGATVTIVNGNLSTTSVVINGIGSTILVTGCISNLTTVTLVLTPADLDKIGKSIRQQLINSTCSIDLGAVNLVTSVQGSTCKRVEVNKITSGFTMSALLTISSSRCNLWWIILVSVIGGLIIIGAIVAVLVYTRVVRKRNAKWSKRARNEST